MMKSNKVPGRYIKIIFLSALTFFQYSQALAQSYAVKNGAYEIVVEKSRVSSLEAVHLLGVHSLWWGHQNDLWVPGTSSNYPSVENFFQRVKGITRFGGGANEIPWTACSGSIITRQPVKAVDWAAPMPCLFGVPEYLNTLRKADNKNAWLIANIAGNDYKSYSEIELQANSEAAATYLRSNSVDFNRYWELGNELERGRYQWPPEMIAKRASAAGQSILRKDPAAMLIAPLIEYNAANQPPRRAFNERLLKALSVPLAGVALHLYYDGSPGGPSIPTQISTVIETANIYQKVKGNPAAIWITEHGRWPEGDPSQKDWKANWYKTSDREGVIGTADFIIGLSQIPEVAGAMLHGVRAGPWNIFDKTATGPSASGVGKLLLLLADTGATKRLITATHSENQSGYKGGYDIRAAAFERADGSVSIWVINRAATAITVNTDLSHNNPSLQFTTGNSLICLQSDGKCAGDQFRVFAVSRAQAQARSGSFAISLPAHSVSTLTFAIPQ